jgi:hypothetical protein
MSLWAALLAACVWHRFFQGDLLHQIIVLPTTVKATDFG